MCKQTTQYVGDHYVKTNTTQYVLETTMCKQTQHNMCWRPLCVNKHNTICVGDHYVQTNTTQYVGDHYVKTNTTQYVLETTMCKQTQIK